MKAHTQKSKSQISLSDARKLVALLKPYSSGWVALSPDEREVVAAAQTLHETRERAMNLHIGDAVFVKVIPADRGYLPRVQ